MSNPNRVLFLCSYLALASTSSLTALSCSEEAPDVAPVTLQIRYAGESDTSSTLRKDQSIFSLAPGAANVTKFDEVARILVDITDATTGLAHYVNFDLTRVNSADWQGEIPSLPRHVQLHFVARATNSSGELAFSGETLATLASGGQQVAIPLATAQNDTTFPIPRMLSIVYPSELQAGQEEQFAFTIQGSAGLEISVKISPNGSTNPSPEFLPATGTVTLSNTVASFVSVFTAPEVGAITQRDYQVTITAANSLSSISITTNFRVIIKPRGSSVPDVRDTRPVVHFNPVILSLNANGSAIPGAVELRAEVSDDGPSSELQYQWSYAPEVGSPNGSFADAAMNPAIFEDYDSLHQGVISLAVADGDNGTTTLHYTVTTHQFDEAVDHGSSNGIKRIVAGHSHTCVLTGQGRVRCWGDNRFGQLGYGNTVNVGNTTTSLPYVVGDVPLPPLDPVVELAAGGFHTCALLRSGLLYCWGANYYGQLGYGHTNNVGDGEPVTSPGYVKLGGRATLIAAGGSHTCAVLESESVRCWGFNYFGQLGHGNTEDIGDNEPVYAAGDLHFGDGVLVKALTLGEDHTCALFTSGGMRCWGNGGSGQLGYGNTNRLADDESLETIPNVSLTGVVRKADAGAYHTCALTDTGALRCWGDGYAGQLGQVFGGVGMYGQNWGDQTNELPSTMPHDINTGAPVTEFATAGRHVCALSSDGQLKCWGANDYGQLGTGNAAGLEIPPPHGVDLGGASAYRISVGLEHTCALRSNGSVRCWGRGAYGQLGRGSTDNFTTPDADTLVFQP